MKARGLVAALAGVLLFQALAVRAARRRPAPGLTGRVIASIAVVSRNVFNTSVYPESKRVYRVANALHRTTRESVIRRELLFAVGEPYDPNLLRETERNLRLLPFIRHAEADAVINSSGTVDVTVRVYDAWSLELVANFKRVGGTTDLKGGFTERNVLGLGGTLSVVYTQSDRSLSKSVFWRDGQFLGRHHLDYVLSADKSPDNEAAAFSVNRPFYASITRASGGVTASYAETKLEAHAGEAPVGPVLRRLSEVGVNYGVALATSTERTRRVRAGLLSRRADFSLLPGTPESAGSAPQRALFLQLSGDWQELDYVTERRMQKFTRDEDYNLGLGVFPTLAWSPPLRGLGLQESQALPGLLVTKGFDWEDRLLMLRASYTTAFVNGANANRTAGGDVLYFIAGLPRQTLAFHASYDHGWRLDPAARLELGESSGLRGYGLSQFAGERRLLFNIEDRLFLYDELLRVVDVGATAFFDSGYVWKAGEPVRPADLRNSIGVGLRLAASRSAGNNPVRIDFARALSPNGTRSRWTLSIIGGQAFGPQ